MPLPIPAINSRERIVWVGLALSKSHAQIADQLGLSPGLVSQIRGDLCGKLGVRDVQGLVRTAYSAGVIKFENGKWS